MKSFIFRERAFSISLLFCISFSWPLSYHFQVHAAQQTVDSSVPAYSGGNPLIPTSSRNIVRSGNYWYIVYRTRSYDGTYHNAIFINRCSTSGCDATPTKLCGDNADGKGTAILRTENRTYGTVSIDINDERNTLHVVWTDGITSPSYQNGLYYSKCTDLANYNSASSWSQAGGGTSPRYDTIVSNSSSTPTYANSAITVDHNNKPHIAYVQSGTPSVYYTSYNTSDSNAWKASSVLIANDTYGNDNPSIDVTSDNYVHIAWQHRNNSTQQYYQIDYAKSDNASNYNTFTKTAQIIYVASKDIRAPSLAVDRNDGIYVVAGDNSGVAGRYNYYRSGAWKYVNGSGTYQTSFNDWNIVVGTNWGSTDHRTLQVLQSGSYDINRYSWNSGTETFENRTDTSYDTTTTTGGNNICIEKRKSSGYSEIGFVWYNSTQTDLYFDTFSMTTAIELQHFQARQHRDEVLLQWRTGYEANNLGFHIYRQEKKGERIRVTPDILKGTALITGLDRPTAGHSYAWVDSLPEGVAPVKYWLEDIDLGGKKTIHGPFAPEISPAPLPQKAQAKLLRQLAFDHARQDTKHLRLKNLQARLQRNSALKHMLSVNSQRELNPAAPLAGAIAWHSSPKEMQWILAGVPAIKLFTQEEGWYRVTQPELVAAGLSPDLNPAHLQLYVDGVEQAITVNAKRNGQFGPQDYIEFYGTGWDKPYTDTRVYWLVTASRAGKRVPPRPRGLKGQPGPVSFPFTVEKKPRTIYFSSLRNGDADNFFGPIIGMGPSNQTLNLSHLDPAPPAEAKLEVALQGFTIGSHRVKVLLNEVELGTFSFEGQTRGMANMPVFQAALKEGENRVSLIAQNGETDMSLLDYIRLTYWHTYTAEDDALRFTAPGGRRLAVSGFSNEQIHVVDVTEPGKPEKVHVQSRREGSTYAAVFETPGHGERVLYALTAERMEKPAALELNQPSQWHKPEHEGEFVLITHGLFGDKLQPLKALREAQGISVALIEVEDLYDEFAFGTKSPQALRDFLTHARKKWQKPPRFVLLVGDASADQRNYLGFGNFDLVPTKLVDTAYLETACDDCLADFDGDGIPDIALGRFPVSTPEEAAVIVSKVASYDQGTGAHDILLVADMNETWFDFTAASREIKALLPAGMRVAEVYRDDFNDDNGVRKEIVNKFNQGLLLANYIGHGSIQLWRGNIFSVNEAETLTNNSRLPIVLAVTCLNGFFQFPMFDTLAEALIKNDNGGAAAVWASSGLTEPAGQSPMNKEFIRQIFNGHSTTIGEAVQRAKAATGDPDVRRTWILFGDPSMKLKY